MKLKSLFVQIRWLTLVSALALAGCGGGGGDPIPAGDGVTGTWDIYYYSETTSKDWLALRQSGGTLGGQWHDGDDNSTMPIEGTIEGSSVKVIVQIPDPSISLSIQAQVAGDGRTMTGTWFVSGSGSMDGSHPWRAVKRP